MEIPADAKPPFFAELTFGYRDGARGVQKFICQKAGGNWQLCGQPQRIATGEN